LPYAELASEATRIYRERSGARLALVAGNNRYARAIAFYSKDEPAEFTYFDFRRAPWVTPEALSRDGLLAVCQDGDSGCLASASRFATKETSSVKVTVAHTFLGYQASPASFVLVITPPRQ
jgi:hypothetical protein